MSQTFGRYQVDPPRPPEAMRWTTEPVRPEATTPTRCAKPRKPITTSSPAAPPGPWS